MTILTYDECEAKIIELRQQLADSQKREVMLRGAIRFFMKAEGDYDLIEAGKRFTKALVVTADLKDVRLCHAEPDSYRYKHHDSFGVGFFWSHRPTHQGSDAIESVPLYRAWEPKP